MIYAHTQLGTDRFGSLDSFKIYLFIVITYRSGGLNIKLITSDRLSILFQKKRIKAEWQELGGEDK